MSGSPILLQKEAPDGTLSPALADVATGALVVTTAPGAGVEITGPLGPATAPADSVATVTTQTVNATNTRVRSVELASAALPGAGAFTAQAATAIAATTTKISYFVTYTRGAAGGYPQFQMLWGNGTEEGPEMVRDTALIVAQPLGIEQGYQFRMYGPTPSGAGAITYVIAFDVPAGATTAKLLAAELGAVGTPGTIAIAYCAWT